MPQVPTYGPRHVDTRPLPGVLRGPAPGPDVYGAQLGETLVRVGVRGLDEALQLRREAKTEADALVDVQTQNQLASIESTLLRDPRTGALLTTGPATLDATRQTLMAYDEQADTIAGGLTSARQQLSFERARLAGRLRIQSTLDSHAQSEMRRFAGQELTAFVANQQQEAMQAAVAFGDPAREQVTRATIAGALTSAVTQIQTIGPTLGMGPEQIAQQVAATQSAVHAGVVTSLLAQDRPAKAQQYFDEVTKAGQLTDPERARLTKMLETATAEQAGSQAADAIWAELGPKGESDPINLDTMEAAARAQFPDDPTKRKATIQQLRERKVGVDAGRQDRKEAISGRLWGAVAKGIPLDQLRTMPTYLAAPGPLQVQLRDYLVSEAERRQAKAEAADARQEQALHRAERARETEGWSMFWHYNQAPILAQMTENQILSLLPTLGVTHTNHLIESKRRLGKSDDTVRAATIDDELFKATAASAGLNAYTPKTDTQKATLGQLKNTVEAEIDRQQTASGKTLTREAKQQLMQGIVDERVMLDRWGGDESAIAAVMNPSDQAVAYVPVAEIPDTSLTEWVSVIRKQFPSEARKTRTEILSRWRDRIQRAHAAAVLGLGAEEELRRLQGR